MRISKSSFLTSALLIVAVGIAVFALSASAAAPLKISNCNKAVRSPRLLTLECGDGNTVVKGLTWSSFGAGIAQAKGTFVTNTCEPNCAAGKNVSYSVKLKATGSLKCKGSLRVYGKLTLQFTGRAPGPGVPRTFKLACPY